MIFDATSYILGTKAGGGGGDTWPVIDGIFDGNIVGSITLEVQYQLSGYASTNIDNFLTNYATNTEQNPLKATISPATSEMLKLSAADFKAIYAMATQAEYSGCVYGYTEMITNLNLVLLGDYSQGGDVTGNVLVDSVSNYSAIILQGVYSKIATSVYNTSILYISPSINSSYWAGMKDRNGRYECYVTFDTDSTVSLSGNKQVIIYGMP